MSHGIDGEFGGGRQAKRHRRYAGDALAPAGGVPAPGAGSNEGSGLEIPASPSCRQGTTRLARPGAVQPEMIGDPFQHMLVARMGLLHASVEAAGSKWRGYIRFMMVRVAFQLCGEGLARVSRVESLGHNSRMLAPVRGVRTIPLRH